MVYKIKKISDLKLRNKVSKILATQLMVDVVKICL